MRRGKGFSVDFNHNARGKVDMLGNAGRNIAKYASKILGVGRGKAYRAKWSGRCDFTYTGAFSGMEKSAKAVEPSTAPIKTARL